MRMSRPRITLSFSIRSLKNSLKAAPHKSRSNIAGVAVAVVVSASLAPSSAPVAHAARNAAPVRQAAAQFLTLPFVPNSRMSVLSGWYYSGNGGFHGGIDYINGDVGNIGGWRTFPVIASAD